MTALLEKLEKAADADWWHASYAAARDRGYDSARAIALADKAQRYAMDAAGHEHLPAGSPEGGEFTGKPEDGQAPNDMAVSLPTEEQPTGVTPTSQPVAPAAFPSPDRMAQTLKLLDENMGLVKNAVRWAQAKYKGRDEHDLISNANMALWKAAQSWDESKGPFENYANVAIANALKRGKNVQEHTSLSGKEGENIDVESPREQEPTGPGVAEMHAEIAKLPAREREIMTKVAQGMKGEAIANALSIPHATVRTIIARTKPLLAAALQPREQYQAAHDILRYAEDASGHEHVGAGVPEGGQFTGGDGQSPDEMAAKLPKRRKKDNRVNSPVFSAPVASAEGPLANAKTADEVQKIVNPKNPSAMPATWDSPNPLNLNQQSFLPGVNGEQFTKAVTGAIQQQEATNAFQRLTLPQLYETTKAAMPGLTYWQFQNGIAKLQKDGAVRTGPFTQALATHPAPGKLMPLDREYKWYVGRYEESEQPNRYESERGPWKKRSPRHAVASAVNRLQSLEDHAAEYDADEIADVIGEIAEHFDADTFKDIVRRFGLTKGQTKADLVRLLTERIGKTEVANGEHL